MWEVCARVCVYEHVWEGGTGTPKSLLMSKGPPGWDIFAPLTKDSQAACLRNPYLGDQGLWTPAALGTQRLGSQGTSNIVIFFHPNFLPPTSYLDANAIRAQKNISQIEFSLQCFSVTSSFQKYKFSDMSWFIIYDEL